MITGRLPFEADKAFDVLLMHINEAPPRPREIVPNTPEIVEDIILKAMAKSPAERYPDMKDMVTNLEAAWETFQISVHLESPATEDTVHQATMQIDSVQSFLAGPRFVVAATGSPLHIPQKDVVLIGRTDPRGKVIPDIDLSAYGGGTAGVSRQHARLLHTGEGWMIEDLRSTNGTFINDRRVPPSQPTPLNDGDSVRCGQLVLNFYTDEVNTL
jgi:serine/threonine protein kinase